MVAAEPYIVTTSATSRTDYPERKSKPPWQEGGFCPDFRVSNEGVIWIGLPPAVASGTIVIQKTFDLNEHEILLNSVSYPVEPM